jgi:hypothetical protein
MKGLCQFLLFLLQSKSDIKLKQREIIKLQFMWFCSSLGKKDKRSISSLLILIHTFKSVFMIYSK